MVKEALSCSALRRAQRLGSEHLLGFQVEGTALSEPQGQEGMHICRMTSGLVRLEQRGVQEVGWRCSFGLAGVLSQHFVDKGTP